jgi:4-hydroxysphinganine ceramide fatty acyl 2-hydroxylase
MPSRTLPTLPRPDIESHNTKKSCYVTIGTKVYDVTSFLDDHPGGSDLILEYGGKDVEAILKDEVSHLHSDAAYEILDESLVGFVATEKAVDTAVESSTPGKIIPPSASKDGNSELRERGAKGGLEQRPAYAATGLSSAEDLSKETDPTLDYKTHKFLDLSRPLFPQIWYGGFSKDFYLQQVHRPRHYRGGDSAPLFGNFLEPLSKTAWWVVPMVWLPPVMYGSWYGFNGLSTGAEGVAYWLLGLFLWTLVEYILHRCLFHVDKYLPDNRVGITAHFLLHGIHHYLPMDKYRLVMPPTLFIVLATPFYKLAHFVFAYNRFAAIEVFSGGIFGYICYDLTHYFLHHRNLPLHYRELKKYHLQHHFADFENGFGVTSRFWDRVFGTQLAYTIPVKTA